MLEFRERQAEVPPVASKKIKMRPKLSWMLCWVVSVNIFHRYLLTSTTELETRLWNLNRAKDSLLWRKTRSSLALQVTECCSSNMQSWTWMRFG